MVTIEENTFAGQKNVMFVSYLSKLVRTPAPATPLTMFTPAPLRICNKVYETLITFLDALASLGSMLESESVINVFRSGQPLQLQDVVSDCILTEAQKV